MKVVVNSVASYKGHSLKESGSIDLSLRFKYDELVKTITLTQMLNNDVTIKAKLPGEQAIALGMFRIKSITIDGDGETSLKLNSTNDFVEIDNLNNLVTKELFRVNFVAAIESEDDNG